MSVDELKKRLAEEEESLANLQFQHVDESAGESDSRTVRPPRHRTDQNLTPREGARSDDHERRGKKSAQATNPAQDTDRKGLSAARCRRAFWWPSRRTGPAPAVQEVFQTHHKADGARREERGGCWGSRPHHGIASAERTQALAVGRGCGEGQVGNRSRSGS